MFGLSSPTPQATPENFLYDLEKKLTNIQERKKLEELVNGRIRTIQNDLRGGESKEEYALLNTLLLGYQSLLKVITRTAKDKK